MTGVDRLQEGSKVNAHINETASPAATTRRAK
jgi:hypothetical protein